jgi:AcrR family transcriptional regulator
MIVSHAMDRVEAMAGMKSAGNGRPALSPAEIALVDHEAKPRRKRDRAGKKQALMLAALKLFASKGYEATTTREIASCAGCAEGLIHRYFSGKAGLLPALIEYRVSREVAGLSHLRPAARLEDEFQRLVDWEVERLWEDRDFLRVLIPRAILDPEIGSVLNRAVVSRAKAIFERLKHYKPCLALSTEEVEALAMSVGMLGLVFGFMRPIVLGQDPTRAKQTAATIARILVHDQAHQRAS